LTSKSRNPEKPWVKYKKSNGSPDKLFQPGWPGSLDESELECLQAALMNDDQLSYWWGFRPGMKRKSAEAILRVSMSGSPCDRGHNASLARRAGRRPQAGDESDSAKVTKPQAVSPPRLGRPRIESWEGQMLKLASDGVGVKGIAKRLRDSGLKISHMTVARRLKELRGQLMMPLGS
jgi:hypothetical protein